MRLFWLSLMSAIIITLSGCSSNMPSVGNAPSHPTQMPMNANASSAYPSADLPRAMPVAPVFNPPQFYRTSYSPIYSTY
jgi:uncharacterized protein YceK